MAAAYRRILLRDPKSHELEIAMDFMRRQQAGFKARPLRSTFKAAVPKRLEVYYLLELSGEDCLSGPRDAWEYHKGWWGNAYNLTQEATTDQGPFALLRAPTFEDGRALFDLTFDKGCENVGFLLRAHARGALADGTLVVFDVPAQEIRLMSLGVEGGAALQLLAQPCELKSGVSLKIKLQIQDSTVKAYLDGELCMNYSGDQITKASGQFGVQATGAAMHLADLTIRANGKTTKVRVDDPGSPLENATALFCLTLLNLNEFLYVD